MKTRTLVGLLLLAVLVSGCSGLLNVGGNGSVAGTVTLDGEEPGNVDVEVAAAGTRYKTVADRETGAYQLTGLPQGNYSIVTQGAGVAESSESVLVRRGDKITGVDIDTAYLPPLPYTLTFDLERNANLMEPFNSSPFSRTQDQWGDWVYELAPEKHVREPGAVGNWRYALLKYPAFDEFAMEVEFTGPSANNPAFIFGWQDPAHYDYVFLSSNSSSTAHRVAYVRGSAEEDYHRPGLLGLYQYDKSEYHTIRVEVTRVGDEMRVQTYMNDEHIEEMEAFIPRADYTPGRIGIGGHNSEHHYWFKSIRIEEL